MTTTTTITPEDGLFMREIAVEKSMSHRGSTFLTVKDTQKRTEIQVNLDANPGCAKAKLIEALLGENATVVTDMPKAQLSGEWVEAGTTSRSVFNNPDDIRRTAKNLLAIAAKITEHNAEQEAAKAAEAEKEYQRTKRRDELTLKFRGFGTYAGSTHILQQAIDYAIDLEEAAKVS